MRTRESAHSAAAERKLAKVRVGMPDGAVVVSITNFWRLPKKCSSTANDAAQPAACADGYSGCGGVGRSGTHVGCGANSSPVCAAATALNGRQALYSYLPSHTAT